MENSAGLPGARRLFPGARRAPEGAADRGSSHSRSTPRARKVPLTKPPESHTDSPVRQNATARTGSGTRQDGTVDGVERGRLWAWIAWGVGTTLFLYGFAQRVAPSVMIGDLMRDFSASGAILGNLSAFYFYAYAGIQIPVGVLLDRWGPRRLLAGAALISAVGSLLFSTSSLLTQAYAGRLLIGVGAGVCFVAALKIAMLWLPLHRYAAIAGLTMCLGTVGGIGGQAPLAAILEFASWREVMIWAAVFAALCGGAIWLAARPGESATSRASRKSRDGIASPALLDGLRLVMSRSQTWLLALNLASHAGPMLSFAGLWGVAYLMARFGLERTTAAIATSMMLVGWGVGSAVAGWVSDLLQRRKILMIVSSLIAIVGWPVIILAPALSPTAVVTLLFTIGLAGGAVIIGFAVANETTPSAAGGVMAGVLNTANMTAGAALQVLIGWLLDLGWDGRMGDGVRLYSVDTFNDALLVYFVCGAISLITVIFIRETYAKRIVD